MQFSYTSGLHFSWNLSEARRDGHYWSKSCEGQSLIMDHRRPSSWTKFQHYCNRTPLSLLFPYYSTCMRIPHGHHLSHLWPEELCPSGCGLREHRNQCVNGGNTCQETRPPLHPWIGKNLEVSQPALCAVKRWVGNCGCCRRVTQKMRNKCLIGPTSSGLRFVLELARGKGEHRKYRRLPSTCRKVQIPPKPTPRCRGYIHVCAAYLCLWKNGSKSTDTRSPTRLGVQFSSLQFTAQVVTKANIKALQFANYRRDPGLVGPIRHLLLIFCVTRRLHSQLPTHLLTALRAGWLTSNSLPLSPGNLWYLSVFKVPHIYLLSLSVSLDNVWFPLTGAPLRFPDLTLRLGWEHKAGSNSCCSGHLA